MTKSDMPVDIFPQSGVWNADGQDLTWLCVAYKGLRLLPKSMLFDAGLGGTPGYGLPLFPL